MAFPHPQSRKDHDGNEDKPGPESVAGKFVKRTVNITKYRNGKNDVYPAKNRTCDALTHNPPRFTIPEPPEALIMLQSARFDTELLGVLCVQPLPAAELHGVGAD